jgi:hypothetical protein
MKHKDEVLDIFLKWRLKLEGELRLFGQIIVVSTLQILSLKFAKMKGSNDILMFIKHHNKME